MGETLKTTFVPEHISVAEAVMEIDGTKTGLTVIEMLFDVTVVLVAQVAFEVKMHLMTSAFAKADVMNDVPVAIFTLFFVHW